MIVKRVVPIQNPNSQKLNIANRSQAIPAGQQRVDSNIDAHSVVHQARQQGDAANSMIEPSDPFIRQLRNVPRATNALEGFLPNDFFEREVEESSRVALSRERSVQTEKEQVSLFGRGEESVETRSSRNRGRELPPMEPQRFGRAPIEKPEFTNQLQKEAAEREIFIPYEEYKLNPRKELDLGYIHIETRQGIADQHEEELQARRAPENEIPPAFLAPFPTPIEEDFKKAPPPLVERMDPPVPPPLQPRTEKINRLSETVALINLEGVQPSELSLQDTVRELPEFENPEAPQPGNVEPDALKRIRESKESSAMERPQDYLINPKSTDTIAQPSAPVNASTDRIEPVLEFPQSKNQPLDTYEQIERMLRGPLLAETSLGMTVDQVA
ncbi:MAG: hypothetical protein VX278_00760 [Myxococcota bacterium]|nr:hypothetical protein [Myxococcota bacterium]